MSTDVAWWFSVLSYIWHLGGCGLRETALYMSNKKIIRLYLLMSHGSFES